MNLSKCKRPTAPHLSFEKTEAIVLLIFTNGLDAKSGWQTFFEGHPKLKSLTGLALATFSFTSSHEHESLADQLVSDWIVAR